jgi:hypothetical protein
MLLAYRLVRLIETHSERLAQELTAKLQACEKTRAFFEKVPPDDFQQRVLDVYTHLGEWLLGKAEAEIEGRFTEIGKMRAVQGVVLSEMLWVMIQMKDHLCEFLKEEAAPDRPVEAYGELEMQQRLEQFFDRALYYAAVGYESARTSMAATAGQ